MHFFISFHIHFNINTQHLGKRKGETHFAEM
jgi:hypothetical protein